MLYDQNVLEKQCTDFSVEIVKLTDFTEVGTCVELLVIECLLVVKNRRIWMNQRGVARIA